MGSATYERISVILAIVALVLTLAAVWMELKVINDSRPEPVRSEEKTEMPKLIDPTLLVTALSIQQNASANSGVCAMLDELIARINNGEFDASHASTLRAAFSHMPPGRLETMASSGQVLPGVTVKLCTKRRDLPVVYSRFSRVPMPGEHVEYELRVYQVDAVVMQPIAEDPDRVADVYLLGFEAAARASEEP